MTAKAGTTVKWRMYLRVNAVDVCEKCATVDTQPADGGDMSQTFCGSKAYAAPEILQGRTYDPMKADVWALGVIMYIFITGKMPFDETKVSSSFTIVFCVG